MAVAEAVKIGKVVQVIGPVVDIEFPGSLPAIYNAVRVTGDAGGQKVDIIVEVEQHLGENRVRTVAMKPTDGLQRGMAAEDQGGPISMPVGPETLGRVLNVLGGQSASGSAVQTSSAGRFIARRPRSKNSRPN
jgi:F-type H+-transporting ATPase subunit beta